MVVVRRCASAFFLRVKGCVDVYDQSFSFGGGFHDLVMREFVGERGEIRYREICGVLFCPLYFSVF